MVKIKQDNSLNLEISRLRKLRELDTKAYKALKTKLPYFVGAEFTEGIRNSKSFVKANYLTLDVDNYQLDSSLEELLSQDETVLMAFVSPSGTGFKAIFKLNVPCQSLAQYSEFYKLFSRQFAEKIGLAGSIDLKTCDATRACFLSFDENAYYNANAKAIEWQQYIVTPIALEIADNDPKTNKEIDTAKMDKVLDQINPNRITKKVYAGYVPEELQKMENDIKDVCKLNNWSLENLFPINYGLKVQVRQGYKTAEINLFFGKRGYTVVRSPKTGTDIRLAEMLYLAMHDMLFGPEMRATFLNEDLLKLLSVN